MSGWERGDDRVEACVGNGLYILPSLLSCLSEACCAVRKED